MPAPINQANPLRLFVSHHWQDDEDYHRVFEFLEAADHFYYRNCARPETPRPLTGEAMREALRAEIGASEAVVLLAAQYSKNAETLQFMSTFAQSIRKPVLVLRHFGIATPVPVPLQQGASELLDWDGRALIAALRHHGRGEDIATWDTVEFTLD
jgi:hypothetical protein